MFIPLFCLSHLMFNENTDIEIGICDSVLPKDIETSLDIIRNECPDSEIIIDYSLFESNRFDGKYVLNNTIRFLEEPIIKDEYTYITDIDIICCEEIKTSHIKDMIAYNSNYSNMVRTNSNRMTGLHFTKTSSYYPLPNISDINIGINDEMVLYNIVKKREQIDLSRKFRPVHGIHMSLNRPTVGGSRTIPGWGADVWKDKWKELSKCNIYISIYKYFSKNLINLIDKLEAYYANRQ